MAILEDVHIQVALDIAAGAVVAGCVSGEVVLFLWHSSASAFSASEAAEWRVLLLSEGQDSAELPQVPSGFVCAMRLRQHQADMLQWLGGRVSKAISPKRKIQTLNLTWNPQNSILFEEITGKKTSSRSDFRCVPVICWGL